MEGWFKLHRKIMENPIFSDADLLRLWIFCLSKATYKYTKVMIDKQEVELYPGQFVTGRFALYADYNLGVSPRKKVKDTTLWSWLKRLETYGNIDIKTTNKYSVVTVLKWHEYQETLTTEPQQIDNKLTADCCQTDTNKKLRSEEGKEKDMQPPADKPPARTKFNPPTVQDVQAYCLERGNNVDPERWVDHYTSNGWKVGKNPMKDWKSAVRTWEKNSVTTQKVYLSKADETKRQLDLLDIDLREGELIESENDRARRKEVIELDKNGFPVF